MKRKDAVVDRVTVSVPEKLYGSPAEMAALYGVTEAYLKKLRHLRQGPPYRKLGRMVLYPLLDFARWFESTTEPREADPSL